MNRAEILDAAKEYVTKDRAATHGDAEANFGLIAAYWSAHLNKNIKPHDVAVMMTLFKLARMKSNPAHVDSATDAAGYAAIGGEIGSETSKRAEVPVSVRGEAL
jgi:hypothetical protein